MKNYLLHTRTCVTGLLFLLATNPVWGEAGPTSNVASASIPTSSIPPSVVSSVMTNAPRNRDVLQLDTLVVESRKESENRQSIERHSLKTHKVVDLAEILSDEMVEVQMIRKSGYGNEVSMRGFGQENMRVLLDGGLLEGACGSRKDPSLSHINMLTVDDIIIRQGPFDVTKPGCLGGYVDVLTKKPEPGFGGELLAKAGSYGFLSGGGMGYAGEDTAQALAGYNWSESGQYEDGSGHKLWKAREGINAPYNEAGRKADAFSKQDIWGKLRVTPNERNTVLLEHTYGRGTDILTPRVDFDTEKEITHLSKAGWEMLELGTFSDKLTLSFYRNEVDHYPFQAYRAVPIPKNNKVQSVITGGGIQNVDETDLATFTYGIDLYHRDWWGDVYNSLTGAKLNNGLIPSVQTLNAGSYLQADKDIGKWSFGAGLRFDHFQQEADDDLKFTKNVTSENRQTDYLPGGYLSVKYFLAQDALLFGGVGRSYRTPTSIERYIQGSPTFFGNPKLEPTANTELDLGFKCKYERATFQLKGFYSDLDDFIYQELNDDGYKSYANIDAHIYGADAKIEFELEYGFSLAAGVAYQKGDKESSTDNNTDNDLGQIAPLKAKSSLNYNLENPLGVDDTGLFGTLEWVHSSAATEIDSGVGEQKLKPWDIMNIRVGYRFKYFTLNLGIDNVFDRTYAVANSYEWDVLGGTAANAAIVNEPGRFFYASLSATF